MLNTCPLTMKYQNSITGTLSETEKYSNPTPLKLEKNIYIFSVVNKAVPSSLSLNTKARINEARLHQNNYYVLKETLLCFELVLLFSLFV